MSVRETRFKWNRPQRADYEELLHSPVGALRRYTDRDGRPLCGEAVVTDPKFRAGLEQRTCHYAGSRRNHPLPMNVSALRQMTRNWDEILATANCLRELFTDGPVPLPESLGLGMCVAYAGVSLPLFLLYRADEPMDNGQVPGYVSGLHKASIDIASSIQLMLVESFRRNDVLRRSPGAIVDSVIDFVEREGLLIGQKGVCAGPPPLIRELLEAMMHGRGRRLEDGARAVESLGRLTGLRSYVEELMKIWIAKQLIIAYNGRLMDAVEAHARGAGWGWRAAEIDARIREHRLRQGQPAAMSNIVSRQERVLRALDETQFRRLLRAMEAVAAFLVPPKRRACAQRLLDAVRAEPGGDEAEVVRSLRGAGGGPAADFAAAALAAAARVEHAALRFFAATEIDIIAALQLRTTPRPLTARDLASVFGVMPREHLGALLGIESSVDMERVVFRGSEEVVLG